MNMNDLLWDTLLEHAGHAVEIAVYRNQDGEPVNVSLEDMDTNSVILDAELYTLTARNDNEDREYDESLYRQMRHEYLLREAKEWANHFIEERGLDPDDPNIVFDYDYLAETFEENHDCNFPDSDQWNELLEEYAKENFSELV